MLLENCLIFLVFIFVPLFLFLYVHFRNRSIKLIVLFSILSYFLTIISIPSIRDSLLSSRSNLWGYDLCKIEKIKIAESLGIVSGTLYIVSVCLIMFLLFQFSFFFSVDDCFVLKFNLLLDLCAGLFCSMFMLFLGFSDNVLDLRWRTKLILPSLAVLPLLVCYNGPTNILVPVFLRKLLKKTHIELGFLYKIYIGMVAVYCSNTINIFAGINGLETGQSIVICVSIIIHNLIELKGIYKNNHFFSLICMFPFLGTTLGLTHFNWYPSSVFVGDSFTYFAGMTFAVVGVLGHFSKTLMVLFIPQWINFFYSLPQLFHLYGETPRHRIPILNKSTGLLESSGNLTLINLFLEIFGPMSERNLTLSLLAFQVVCNSVGLYTRYLFIKYYYPEEEFEMEKKSE